MCTRGPQCNGRIASGGSDRQSDDNQWRRLHHFGPFHARDIRPNETTRSNVAAVVTHEPDVLYKTRLRTSRQNFPYPSREDVNAIIDEIPVCAVNTRLQQLFQFLKQNFFPPHYARQRLNGRKTS